LGLLLVRRGDKKPIKVEFEATLKRYLRGGIEEAYTLNNIKNIKRIR